jgi:hypothetical protein
MTHMLPLLPAIGCGAMMFGVGGIGRLVARTSLGRRLPFGRRAQVSEGRDGAEHTSS